MNPSPNLEDPRWQRLEKVRGYMQVDPANRHLRDEEIDLLLDLRELDAARIKLDQALQAEPGEPSLLFRLATLAMIKREFADAEKLLTGLIAAGVREPGVAYNLAYCQFVQRRFADTRQTLTSYPEARQVPAAIPLEGRCLHHMGELPAAQELLHAHLAQYPEDVDAQGLAALVCVDQNQFKEARELATAALRRDPNRIEALIAIGTVDLNEENFEAAAAAYQQVLSINARDGRSWLGMGIIMLLSQRLPDATECLRRATEAMPEHSGTWVTLGWCLVMQNHLEEAEAAYRHAVEASRAFSEAHGGLAVVAALKGDKEVAKRSMEIARRLDPGSMSAAYADALLSGNAKDAQGLSKLATDLLQSKGMLDPQNPSGRRLIQQLTLLGKR